MCAFDFDDTLRHDDGKDEDAPAKEAKASIDRCKVGENPFVWPFANV